MEQRKHNANILQFYERQMLQGRKYSFGFLVANLVYIPVYKVLTPSGNFAPILGSSITAAVHACAFSSYFCRCKTWPFLPVTAHAMSLIVYSAISAVVHPEVQVRLSKLVPGLFGGFLSDAPGCGNPGYLHDGSNCHVYQSYYATMLLEATCIFYIIFILSRKVALAVSLTCTVSYAIIVLVLGKYNNCLQSCAHGRDPGFPEFIILVVNVFIAATAKWMIEGYHKNLFLELRAKETEVVHEKVLRCRAEFDREMNFLHDPNNRTGSSESQAAVSGQVVSNFKLEDTEKKHALQMFASLAQREHWYINLDDIMLQPGLILGMGGFGAVVAGSHHGMPVAVKIAKGQVDHNQRGLAELANELRILRRVRHHNVVHFYGACIDPDSMALALVMEKVEGVHLDSFVEMHGRVRDTLARHMVILDTSSALLYLHNLSPPVAHCDLKPSNIMVERRTRGPRAKLLDFGLARISIGQSVHTAGTLAWMAPEVVRGQGPVNRVCADVFSFGRIAHFVTTGIKPYDGLSRNVIRIKALQKESTLLRWPANKVPEDCIRLINECTSFECSSRPSMDHVMSRLLTAMSPEAAKVHSVQLTQAILELQPYWDHGGDVISYFNVFDGIVARLSEGWLSLCGECSNLFEFFQSDTFVRKLQEAANHVFDSAEHPFDPVCVDLGIVRGHGANGVTFEGRAMVTFPVAKQTSATGADDENYLAVFSLHRIRLHSSHSSQVDVMPALPEEEEHVDCVQACEVPLKETILVGNTSYKSDFASHAQHALACV